MDQIIFNFLKLIYDAESQDKFNQLLDSLLTAEKIKKADLPKLIEKELKDNPKSYPETSEQTLRFLTYMPLSQFRKSPIFDKFLSVLSPEDKKKIPNPSNIWGEQVHAITAGLLDYPRKKLPEAVWLYEEDKPLPRLQPKLRSKILSEARYRLSKFGAKLIGCMLYGGAATYQYKEGADIDCSLYIDWDSFKGDEEIIQESFKQVQIPWDKYVIHLFVKPSNQQEQVEVADASYNVLKDEWVIQPLVMPKDFDPEIFFKPMLEIAEKKAEQIDLLMGDVGREWTKLKKMLRALKEGARDTHVVRDRAEITKKVLKDKISILAEEFAEIMVSRRRLHDQLRQKYVSNQSVGKYERFQLPEVLWKYLDEMGYCEFLKVLTKAEETGVIDKLLDASTEGLLDD